MRLKLFSCVLIVAPWTTAFSAQDSSQTPVPQPRAPEGWKYITAKDGSYQFLFPNETMNSGSREQTSRRAGLASRSQINYCTLKDGTGLVIAASNLSGPALRGLKIGDVYDMMIDGIKDGGNEVSEPKEVPIGNLKGREYIITKGTDIQRKVLLVVKGRVYEMTVLARDKEKTSNATADTFLKSLTLIAKAAPSKDEGRAAATDALSATRAPTVRLKLPQTAAYRPTFTYTDGKEESAGTAFVVKAPSGKKLVLTAVHILEPQEWAKLRSTTLATMAGKKVVDLPGKPAYVGKAFDQLKPLRNAPIPLYNTSEDFFIWELPDGADVTILELADHEPRVNEWVWIAGQQPGKTLLFYRSRITQVADGTMVLVQYDKFKPEGFSGAPVLTADSKVIGTMLAATQDGDMRQGATVANIRKRLEGR